MTKEFLPTSETELEEIASRLDIYGWDSVVYVSSDKKVVYKVYQTFGREVDLITKYSDLLNQSAKWKVFHWGSFSNGTRFTYRAEPVIATGQIDWGRSKVPIALQRYIPGQTISDLFDNPIEMENSEIFQSMEGASDILKREFSNRGIDIGVQNVKIVSKKEGNFEFVITDLCTYIRRLIGKNPDYI